MITKRDFYFCENFSPYFSEKYGMECAGINILLTRCKISTFLYDWGVTTGGLRLGSYDWGVTTGELRLGSYDWGVTTGEL